MIPADQLPPIPKEIKQAIYYRAIGAAIGSLFIVGVYLVSHSPILALVSFAVVAVPLHLGGTLYLISRIRHSKDNKEPIPIRIFLYKTVEHGFTIYTIPVLFVVYICVQIVS